MSRQSHSDAFRSFVQFQNLSISLIIPPVHHPPLPTSAPSLIGGPPENGRSLVAAARAQAQEREQAQQQQEGQEEEEEAHTRAPDSACRPSG